LKVKFQLLAVIDVVVYEKGINPVGKNWELLRNPLIFKSGYDIKFAVTYIGEDWYIDWIKQGKGRDRWVPYG
jgi:hypothetical protein